MFGVEAFDGDEVALHGRVRWGWTGGDSPARRRRKRPGRSRSPGLEGWAAWLKVEFGAEVDFAGFGVVGHFGAGAFVEDGAVVDEVGAVHEFQGFADVVVGDEDAEAAFAEAADNFLDFIDGDGIDAAEGFVEEEKLRAGDEGAGDFEAALFAAAEGVGLALGEAGEVEFVEEGLETEGRARCRPCRRFRGWRGCFARR